MALPADAALDPAAPATPAAVDAARVDACVAPGRAPGWVPVSETGSGGGLSPVSAWVRHPSMVDWPGHMAGVLLVTGCNFRCPFCHNAPLLAAPRERLSWTVLESLLRRFREHWVDAIVISGGEPTLRSDLPQLVRFLRDRGFRVKLDTNGSRPGELEALLADVDYVAMDVKCSLDRYPDLVGCADPGVIVRSIDIIRRLAPEYEFRTTILDPVHDDAHMDSIGALVRGSRRWVLQRFEPRGELLHPDCRAWPRTSPSRLRALRARLALCAQEVLLRGAD
jgi:pyruvate formate lyase activating enzyme